MAELADRRVQCPTCRAHQVDGIYLKIHRSGDCTIVCCTCGRTSRNHLVDVLVEPIPVG